MTPAEDARCERRVGKEDLPAARSIVGGTAKQSAAATRQVATAMTEAIIRIRSG